MNVSSYHAHRTLSPASGSCAPEKQNSEVKTLEVRKYGSSYYWTYRMRSVFFGVHPDELKHCISPGLQSGTALLFGFKGAPLVMGSLSAAIGRLIQSSFHPAAHQVQVYMMARAARGSQLRNLQLAKVLYVLAAFGVQVAMPKGEREAAECSGSEPLLS